MTGRFRAIRLASPAATLTHGCDGAMLVRADQALAAYPRLLTERLAHWAIAAPDQVFVAERSATGWRAVSYAEAFRQVRNLGQALLDRDLSAERPVAILSENSIDHLLLCLAGQHVGIPTAAISVAYSLVSSDFGKLRHILGLLQPGLVYATSGSRYGRAIAATLPPECELVVGADVPADRPATAFADLAATPASAAVEVAHAAVRPDGIAKFLFTSGSTGMPKAVINTHRMLCANQQMVLQSMPFLGDEPPVILDWLPWSHTFGGNHNVGIALYNGGSFHIDDGRPLPGQFARSVENLRDVRPTVYFNVPKGFEELLPLLRADRGLADALFGRLKMMFYAGAGLPQHIWDGFKDLAVETCGERILMTTSLGSTETAPAALTCTWETDAPGHIGLPAPGLEIKLAPTGGKLELRLRGPSITPGYWRQPDLAATAFDEEGFYRIGDALRLADPDDLSKGFLFDGRIAEDFKLATGTWVSVGPLRARVVAACAPLVRDVVVTGHDRDDIGLLIVPDVAACRGVVGLEAGAAEADILHHPALYGALRRRLAELAAAGTGSATRVARALVLIEPLSLDAGEVTDKGSLNQRAILDRRANLVDELYAPTGRVPVLMAEWI